MSNIQRLKLLLKKTRYALNLKATSDYKLIFTSNEGDIKTLYIQGHPDYFVVMTKVLNVDFNNTKNLSAVIFPNYKMKLVFRL